MMHVLDVPAPAAGRAVGVKICGIADAAALDAAADAGADWIGFVFFNRSPRAVTADQASELQRRLQQRASSVGLFVEPSDDEVARVLDVVPLDVLQIYADPGRASAMRRRFGLPVWLACGVATAAELPTATTFDRLVIEARPPAGAERPGGNGLRFDWRLTAGWTAPAPWLLAGGLSADNVAEAVRQSGATAVDVSSGVESAPGIKQPSLIRRFIAAAKGTATVADP